MQGDQLERARAFAVETQRVVGVPARLHEAPNYQGLVSALEAGAVHLAWLPPLSAAEAICRKAIRPIALAERSGQTSYFAALVTHSQSGIRSPADLDGAHAVWVDRESASGYVVIRRALREAGVRLAFAFGEEDFARSHAEVLRRVKAREVDVGATFLLREGGKKSAGNEVLSDGEGELSTVVEAGPIPSDFIAANRAIPTALVEALQLNLLGGRHALHHLACALLGSDGLVGPSSKHLEMLERMAGRIDLFPSPSMWPGAS